MKTPTAFAEETFKKEGFTYFHGTITPERLARYQKSYALHVLEEVEIRTRVHSSPFAQSKVIAQIRKELEQ